MLKIRSVENKVTLLFHSYFRYDEGRHNTPYVKGKSSCEQCPGHCNVNGTNTLCGKNVYFLFKRKLLKLIKFLVRTICKYLTRFFKQLTHAVALVL